jgi:uncharacterized protein (DUF58 family)
VKWHPSAKLHAVVVLVGTGFALGFALGRAEPVVVVAPIAIASLAALSMYRAPEVHVGCELARGQVVEGDEVVLEVRFATNSLPATLEVAVEVPLGLSASLEARTLGTSFAGEEGSLSCSLRADRWGSYRLGSVCVRATGPLGLLVAEQRFAATLDLQVLPSAETLRRLVRPVDSRATAGNQVAKTHERGLEFADIRPFAPGDRPRDLNWRATARHGTLHVNVQHPDRSTDVVLVVDAFSEATLPAAVRAANSLAGAYLKYRDRVGLVSMGGLTEWLRPGAGARQEYLLVQTLLQAQVFASVADRGIEQLPPDVLPRKALVVALSPLEDERFRRLLVDLRTRGIDLVVIEVSAEQIVVPTVGRTGETAHRLWSLQRDLVRNQLRALGIPVVVWTADAALALQVEEVSKWPRVARAYR